MVTERDIHRPPTMAAGSGADGPGGDTDARILLLEDDDGVADVTAAMLEALGCRVQAVADGAEAIAVLQARAEFDLLVADIVMPGPWNGFQVALWAREHRGLDTLFITGFPDHELVADRWEQFAILVKPFTMGELAGYLWSALGVSGKSW